MVRTSTDSTAGLNIIIKIIIIIIVVVAIIVILVAPYTTRLLFRQFNFHLEEWRDKLFIPSFTISCCFLSNIVNNEESDLFGKFSTSFSC